jgi:hypothetical protein
MSKKKSLVVTVSKERSIKDVEKDLKKAGFSVDQVLSEIGCITGAGDENTADKLRKIPGVTDVSPEGPDADVGPPDAPVS